MKINLTTGSNFEKMNTPPPFSQPDNNKYSSILSGGKDNYIKNEENNEIFSLILSKL